MWSHGVWRVQVCFVACRRDEIINLVAAGRCGLDEHVVPPLVARLPRSGVAVLGFLCGGGVGSCVLGRGSLRFVGTFERRPDHPAAGKAAASAGKHHAHNSSVVVRVRVGAP